MMAYTNIDRLEDLLIIAALWVPALLLFARSGSAGSASRRGVGRYGIDRR